MSGESIFRKGIVVVPSDFNGVDWIEKMSSAGLNTLGIHSGGGPAHDVFGKLGDMAGPDFKARAGAAGLDCEYELHAVSLLLDRSLFASKPEYFIFHHRTNARHCDGDWCVSSPDGMELVVSNAEKAAARLAPSTHRHFFWGADLEGGSCHCKDCAHLSASDQSVATSNAIARRLAKSDPKAQVAFLAYLSTLEPPRRVRPEPNVFAEYAPYRRCYLHALDDSNCAVNRRHFKILLELLEVFPPERTHVLEYWLDSSLMGGYNSHPPARAPFSREVVRRDLALYHSLGIRSITTFAVCMDGEYMRTHGDREFLEYAELINAL